MVILDEIVCAFKGHDINVSLCLRCFHTIGEDGKCYEFGTPMMITHPKLFKKWREEDEVTHRRFIAMLDKVIKSGERDNG